MAHAATLEEIRGSAPATLVVGGRAAARVDRLALLALLVGVVATAGGTLLVRLAETGPTATAAYRMGLAGLAVWPFVGMGGAASPADRGRGGRGWAVLAGLFFAADLAVWHLSLHWTTVANASLLGNLAPVFLVLAAWGLFGQRPSRVFLVGLLTVLIGAACLAGASAGLGGRHLAGDVLAVVGAAFYAGYLFAVKRLRATWPTTKVVAVTGLIGGAALVPVAVLSGDRVVPETLAGLAVLLALGLVSHAGGQGLFTFALAHLPATLVALSGLLQPLVAGALAWALFGEPLGPRQAVGGLLVLAGIVLARRAGVDRGEHHEVRQDAVVIGRPDGAAIGQPARRVDDHATLDDRSRDAAPRHQEDVVHAPEGAPIGRGHWLPHREARRVRVRRAERVDQLGVVHETPDRQRALDRVQVTHQHAWQVALALADEGSHGLRVAAWPPV